MKTFEISALARVACVNLCLFLVACGGGGGGGDTVDVVAAAQSPVPPSAGDPGSASPANPLGEPSAIEVSILNPNDYVVSPLSKDSDVYIDRDHTFTNIPAELGSLQYIQTANDDKYVSAADAISFDVNSPAKVYVGIDARMSTLPDWLQSWADSGESVRTSDSEFRLYVKDVPAGRVVLGGNEMGFGMYTVLVTSELGSGGAGAGGGASPTISGTPTNSIVQGLIYSFVPAARDPEGDLLTFSIANKPGWAEFDTRTGMLSGTPGGGDVGDHPGIAIAVTDGVSEASLATFSISVVGTATGSARLSWAAPTENEDGSNLDDLAGFRISYGTSPGSYPNKVTISNPGISQYLVENLTPQTWYFVVTAFNASQTYSEFSNVDSKTITQ